MNGRSFLARLAAGIVILIATAANAYAIPLPAPASMPLEQMSIHIGVRQATFQGRFTFEYIPPEVEAMLFPIPPINATNIEVAQDGMPRS